jgi:hypothetical protein
VLRAPTGDAYGRTCSQVLRGPVHTCKTLGLLGGSLHTHLVTDILGETESTKKH